MRWLAIAIIAAAPVAGQAESMLDGLKEKASRAAEKVSATAGTAAEAVGQVTTAVVDQAQQTVDDTRTALRDEATPAETRAKLDAMTAATLRQLFQDRPDTAKLLQGSFGYAVFDTRQVQYGIAAGYGRGVAVALDTGKHTYMRMGSGGVGISLGFGGFDTKFVIFFENAFSYNKFVLQGLDASAEAGTMTGAQTDEMALRFEQGRVIFALTQGGWKVSAKLAGTRYWPDRGLNLN
ncbi:hypothetical protein F2Q65_18610 [Thiohalocapsa marina]|uniref:Ysc84 actin-binding domain-containing protein n=1 Tax=Thiohalocapsa marina TaxID=424902 RepID=A0A5M8FB12_9GAMM|nr:hypothetical protein F2Q65_18610 [Thiohalocapsa marina]